MEKDKMDYKDYNYVMMADVGSPAYEVIQLRRTIQYITDELYAGMYDVSETEIAVGMLMGLSETINGLRLGL